MRRIEIKTENVSSLTASEYNQVQQDLQNAISDAGIAFNPFDAHQLSLAISINASGGSDFYVDSSTVMNSFTLRGTGNFVTPKSFFNGMRIRFVPNQSNGGPSIVQISSLGSRPLRAPDGGVLVNGQVVSGVQTEATYFENDGHFRIGRVAEIEIGTSTVVLYAGNIASIPNGYSVCDGSFKNSILDPTYSALFSMIGTNYGGIGPQSFAVPNLQDRTVIGVGTEHPLGSENQIGGGLTNTIEVVGIHPLDVQVSERGILWGGGVSVPTNEVWGRVEVVDSEQHLNGVIHEPDLLNFATIRSLIPWEAGTQRTTRNSVQVDNSGGAGVQNDRLHIGMNSLGQFVMSSASTADATPLTIWKETTSNTSSLTAVGMHYIIRK